MSRCEHGINRDQFGCFACNQQDEATFAKVEQRIEQEWTDMEIAAENAQSISVLLEAESLVNGDRAASYGDPKDNFRRWRDMCRATDRPALREITAEDLAVVMICLKVCRDTASVKRDNVVDGAAYFELWNRVRGL